MTQLQPLKIGVVGMGLGTALMLPAIVQHPNYSLTGAFSRRPDIRADFEQTLEAKAFDSMEAMCDGHTVDAVYIATPLFLHRKQTLIALERGKHVIVEKPPAMTLEECDELIGAAERSGCTIVCGETHAMFPIYPRMREIIASGDLGKPTSGLGVANRHRGRVRCKRQILVTENGHRTAFDRIFNVIGAVHLRAR